MGRNFTIIVVCFAPAAHHYALLYDTLVTCGWRLDDINWYNGPQVAARRLLMGFCDAGYGYANSADDTGLFYVLGPATTYISWRWADSENFRPRCPVSSSTKAGSYNSSHLTSSQPTSFRPNKVAATVLWCVREFAVASTNQTRQRNAFRSDWSLSRRIVSLHNALTATQFSWN